MSLLLCLLFLGAAVIFQCRGDVRRALWSMAAGIGLILLIGVGIVPAVLLSITQSSSAMSEVTWRDHNSIVVLGAGTVSRTAALAPGVPIFGHSHITAGAIAWRDCMAHGKDCTIVVSGGDPQRHGAAEATIYSQALLALGVPRTAIVLETHSLNTWQNAAYSTQLIPADRQVVVVTSGIHLKRSLLFFNHFRQGAVGIASDRLDPAFTPFGSGYNFFLTDAVLHEEIGTAQFHVYNLLGLNARPVLTPKP